MIAGKLDKITDDQKIPAKSHFFNNA